MLRKLRWLALLSLFGCASMPSSDEFAETIRVFRGAGESAKFFDNSYGYAVFPTIGKGGLVVGGAHGEGRVYQKGAHVGDVSMTQVTVGAQLGGQAYSQIVFLQDKRAFDEFTSGDFEAVELERSDFVYADPPYDVEFTQYSKDAFGWDEQVRLAEWLARHPGPVVLSNQATERIKRLYTELGFELRFMDAPRMISCNGDRTRATEVVGVRNL